MSWEDLTADEQEWIKPSFDRGRKLFEFAQKELMIDMDDSPYDAIVDLLHYLHTAGGPKTRIDEGRETLSMAMFLFEGEVT